MFPSQSHLQTLIRVRDCQRTAVCKMLVPRLLCLPHCSLTLSVLPRRIIPRIQPTPSPTWKSQFSVRQYQTLKSQNLSRFPCKRSLFTSPTLLCAPSSGEQALIAALAKSFPNATDIAVVDISGGCGSMFEVVDRTLVLGSTISKPCCPGVY